MNYTYSDDHSIIDHEYLDQGNEIKENLQSQGLQPQQFETERKRLFSYARARIPKTHWDQDSRFRTSRAALSVLTGYVESSQRVRKYGLGLTIFGIQPVCKLQPVYIMARQLVDGGFSCFIVAYDELIFWLKEIREDRVLRQELDERFEVDFFFLVEIPDNDDLTASLRQDLLARLELRCQRYRPNIFAVNTALKSVNDILPNSFLGRLILPFAAVNKPLTIEDLGHVEQLYKQRWKLLDDKR